jgi:hypothetical protein
MFSLRTLLAVVLVAAFFAAALVTRSFLWVSVCAALTMGLLLAATVAAFRSGAFVAFAVFGWGYLAVTMTTLLAPVGAALPTTMLLVAVAADDAPNAPTIDGSDTVGSVRTEHFRFVGADWTYFSGSNATMFSGNTATVDDDAEFLLVGHFGFALAFAAMAEMVVRRKRTTAGGKD